MLQVLTSDYYHHVLRFIRASTSTIDILCYVSNFNLYKKSDKANLIYLALKNFCTPQTPVRFILDHPRLYKSNYHCNLFSTRRFKEAGFSVRYLHTGSTQHSKLILFDNKFAVTGSHNLTTRSVVNRYDISILIDAPCLVSFFTTYFDSLWQDSIDAYPMT